MTGGYLPGAWIGGADRCLEPFFGFQARLGFYHGPSWPRLGPMFAPSWLILANLDDILAHLVPILAYFGAILAFSGFFLAPS